MDSLLNILNGFPAPDIRHDAAPQFFKKLLNHHHYAVEIRLNILGEERALIFEIKLLRIRRFADNDKS